MPLWWKPFASAAMDESRVSGRDGAPVCQRPPRPRVLQALLTLAWRRPRPERPVWLRSEVGASLSEPDD